MGDCHFVTTLLQTYESEQLPLPLRKPIDEAMVFVRQTRHSRHARARRSPFPSSVVVLNRRMNHRQVPTGRGQKLLCPIHTVSESERHKAFLKIAEAVTLKLSFGLICVVFWSHCQKVDQMIFVQSLLSMSLSRHASQNCRFKNVTPNMIPCHSMPCLKVFDQLSWTKASNK